MDDYIYIIYIYNLPYRVPARTLPSRQQERVFQNNYYFFVSFLLFMLSHITMKEPFKKETHGTRSNLGTSVNRREEISGVRG